MNILYIGQYSDGTTSKMRADQMRSLLQPTIFNIIDTHVPFFRTTKFLRSIGFRYKKGPLIKNVNNYVLKEIKKSSGSYDLTWIDKAVFLKKHTLEEIRKRTEKLVHFTPDMAFYENKSSHFNKGLPLYDFLITTKSAEVNKYKQFITEEKLIKTTQGFSKDKHFPMNPYAKKDNSVAFIGLAEKSRLEIAEHLIRNGIFLKVAGMGWEKFAKKHTKNSFFQYFGNGIYGEEYTKFISSSKFGLGVLAKRIPELHTTRTFEIPACGTALLTERNEETSSYFEEDEAIFYSSREEMTEKIHFYLNNEIELQKLTNKGLNRVNIDGYDYSSILRDILNQI